MSYRGIGIKLRLFHNQLKTPQSTFNDNETFLVSK